MKRSTLTLSILTALLVSACGGSSSNDEQTKDPTPPKVTPTKPTTPSTGNTSTTGNKDSAGNLGSSAGSSASSSSSDPTPPISSGSAPSGGKPIVITSETKEKEKDKDKDKEPKDDPIKKLETELAQAKANLTEYQTAKQLADEELAKWKPHDKEKSHASLKWRVKEDLRGKFLKSDVKTKLGLNNVQDKKVGVKTIEVALEKKKSELGDEYGDLKATLDAFETAQQEWIDADQHVYTLINNAYTAAQNVNKAQKKVDKLAAEVRKLKADPIAAEEDFYKAKTQLTDLQYDAAEKAAEHNKAASEAKQNENDLDTLQTIKGDLELAQKEAPDDKTITKDLEDVKKKIEENKKTQEKLNGKVSELEEQKNSLVAQLASAQTKAKIAEEIAGNRGVIGNVGLSAQDYFLTVDKAEAVKSATDQKIEAWKLTLKNGSTAKIDVKASSTGTGNTFKQLASDSKTYGYIGNAETIQGAATGTKQITAYNSLNNNKTSIYGFIGDQFYSVGTVTPADAVEKMTDTRARYDGKALLKAAADKGGDNLIADVEATVNFKGGNLEGSFYNFKTYTINSSSGSVTLGQATALADDSKLKEALKADKIIFDASIKGNKFATESEKTGQANVYGYFYGKDAGELGGLVEYKNVFHGSFGGAKSSK